MNPARTQSAQHETVTQSEIEKLLAEVGAGDTASPGPSPRLPLRGPEPDQIQPCRFRRLSSFSAGDLRKLRLRHEEFIRSLTARLSIAHRLNFALQMAKLELLPFQKFADGLANPTHLSLLQFEPLRGVCFLDIPSGLALSIVERELGGALAAPEEPRDLTEIEARLLARVIETIASEWCGFWRDLLDLRPVILGHENSSSFSRPCPPDTLMLILGIEARMGETVELIQLAFPHYTMEPLIQKLNASVRPEVSPAAAVPVAPPKWNTALNDVPLRVTLELPPLELSARQLIQLKPGDLLPLNSDMAGQTRICLERKPVFTSTLGSFNGRWAAQITGSTAGNSPGDGVALRSVPNRAMARAPGLGVE